MAVYYDISDIFEYALTHATLSGIQRTSLNILCRLVNQHGADDIRVIAYHPKSKRVLRYHAGYFAGDFAFDQSGFCKHFSLTGHRLGIRLRDRIGAGMNGMAGAARNEQTRAHVLGPKSQEVSPDAGAEVVFSHGDIVFIPGATWGEGQNIQFLVERRRRDGIKLHHMIYDLIPIMAPEHVVEGTPAKFSAWLCHLCETMDGFVAISKATKDDLDDWMRQRGVSVPVSVVPLCHQFGLSGRRLTLPPSGWSPSDGIGTRVRNAARLPYVLCVGTLESRKNIWTLANVWRRVYDRLGDATPRLIFAGNSGWHTEDFDGFLAGTGSLYGYISIVRAPCDAELAFLYRSCLFSVFASYKEGWGLPIGEGLWFGRPVLCSNVSSMPEVGGALADYTDPASPVAIFEAVLRLICDAQYREARAAEIALAKLRTWDDVAEDLWADISVQDFGRSGGDRGLADALVNGMARKTATSFEGDA